MKNLIVITVVIMFVGCNRPNQTINAVPQIESAILPVDTQAFFALFKDITADSLLLMSEHDSIDKSDFLTGKLIDSSFSPLFLGFADTAGYNPFVNAFEPSYALGKFSYGRYLVLLIRHPGEYVSNRTSVFMFNTILRRIEPNRLWLSEDWGDAGDYCNFSSVLKQSGNSLQVVMRVSQNHPADQTTGRYIDVDSTIELEFQGNTWVRTAARQDTMSESFPFADMVE